MWSDFLFQWLPTLEASGWRFYRKDWLVARWQGNPGENPTHTAAVPFRAPCLSPSLPGGAAGSLLLPPGHILLQLLPHLLVSLLSILLCWLLPFNISILFKSLPIYKTSSSVVLPFIQFLVSSLLSDMLFLRGQCPPSVSSPVTRCLPHQNLTLMLSVLRKLGLDHQWSLTWWPPPWRRARGPSLCLGFCPTPPCSLAASQQPPAVQDIYFTQRFVVHKYRAGALEIPYRFWLDKSQVSIFTCGDDAWAPSIYMPGTP